MKTLTSEDFLLNYPNTPSSFLPKELSPFGKAKFKGDKFVGPLASWSVNDKFDIGTVYPVYDDGETDPFVVGKDGKFYKMTPIAWTKIILI
jgi:hypothetical protein